jgi:hypothetical protein
MFDQVKTSFVFNKNSRLAACLFGNKFLTIRSSNRPLNWGNLAMIEWVNLDNKGSLCGITYTKGYENLGSFGEGKTKWISFFLLRIELLLAVGDAAWWWRNMVNR